MRETAKGLYEFWSSFGITAYPENAIPSDARLPYITYDLLQPSWRNEASYNIRVWYRDTSLEAITRKTDEISAAIGEGKHLTIDGGHIWLFKDDRFVQMESVEDPDALLKYAYLSMIIHVLA